MTGFKRLGSCAVFTVCLLAAQVAGAQSRNPLGEAADYKVDRNSQRTSSMIQDGTMKTVVTNALPDDPAGPAYEVTINYTLRIQFMGTRSGTEKMNTPAEFFTPEFMEDLRRNGTYEGPTFKLRHMGFADARNMDGGFYPHCDKVLIYDIQQESGGGVIDIARQMLAGGETESEIEDMEILTHIYLGVPVLGAVKLDTSGKYQGQPVKAGADYEAP